MTDDSTDALFIALANVQEAQWAAGALSRRAHRKSSVVMPPAELVTALQLVNQIVKALGGTVQAYSNVVNSIRRPGVSIGALDAIAYDTARELLFLSRRLRRGAPVANSISAATALDIAVRDQRRSKGPTSGGDHQ